MSASITKDTSVWGFLISRSLPSFSILSAVFYEDNKEIADYEADFIVRTQLDDGSGIFPWSWGDYPDAWAISKNWCRSCDYKQSAVLKRNGEAQLLKT